MKDRKYERRHLLFYLRVFEARENSFFGHIVDLSTEGMLLISEHPAQVGKTYEFIVNLPQSMEGSRAVNFLANCKWSKSDINPDFHDSGFQLSNISPEDLAIIKELISEYGFEN